MWAPFVIIGLSSAECFDQNIELHVSARRTIYDSFVASNFKYCPLVWHFCGATNNSKLKKIQERCLRTIYKDYESPHETLLETTNTTSLVVSRLRLILLEVYKSLHQLNAKCINGLFEVKSTRYSLRNPVKVLQPKKKTTTYGLNQSHTQVPNCGMTYFLFLAITWSLMFLKHNWKF